jgi:Holliday junction DNA helicase RuvA
MIGQLKGVIDSYGDDYVILDVHGVGYIVSCSGRTLQNLPRPGEAAVLAIETYVREDQIRLFGFVGQEEKEWFKLLMMVQGVGAKVALAILSVLSPGEVATAIALKDVAAISRANGVGKRLAERVVQELKDKGPAYSSVDPAIITLSGQIADRSVAKPLSDAVSALVNLGYAQVRASAAVAIAARDAGDDAGTERLIRLALKELSQN